MLETLPHPALEDTDAPAEFTPEWHRQQDREERAWLDDYARLRRLLPHAA
ncbi:hypothetical protein [Streptomyces olivochromogenes]|uniref:Uncharacterized protein n=1 Tax=Streptomyces olivochromogenes TaxID=1963 RepID=A0A286PHH0_STROL|nr:hypothetical protein [Streptomyces olivochromogenes]GAX58999.1 hypothetical protein SO3561_10574 [Streptomyces olivochromogenes]